jgi:hypothetical protein
MKRQKQNPWPFSSPPKRRPAARKRGGSALTLAAASKAAKAAGYRGTQSFPDWLEAKRLNERGPMVVDRLGDAYRAGLDARERDDSSKEQARESKRGRQRVKAGRDEAPEAPRGTWSADEEKKLQAHIAKGGSLAEFLKLNPGANRGEVTDRAHRYRAQKNVTGPRKCVLCGSTRNIDVMHLDGNESHDEKKNLAYGCRSCNGKLAAAFKRAGMGRPTNQYNPAGSTVPTFGQYAWAVSQGGPRGHRLDTGSAHDEAGAVIHATPKHKRIEYARRIAEGQRARRRTALDERWNPAAEAAKGYKDFHGEAPSEFVEVKEQVHVHRHLSGAGKLERLVVAAIDGRANVTLSGFKGALLTFNEKRNQLFVTGGDQSVELKAFGIRPAEAHELETLGRVLSLDYSTNKTHLGDEGGAAVYRHKLRTTNENGRHVTVRIARYPDLIYRVRDKHLEFSGGSYQIIPEGIDR